MAYPKKTEIALELMTEFKIAFPQVVVKCILADNLCGSDAFVDRASAIFGGVQVISKLRKNQKSRFRGKDIGLTTFLSGLEVV